MDKKERDKFLTRSIGECYHERECVTCGPMWSSYACGSCGEHWGYSGDDPDSDEYIELRNTDFSTYEGLGKLITHFKDTELWSKIRWNITMAEFMDLMTDPDKAANKLYEYLRSH